MIVSEIEVDTPEEWLSVLIELEEKVAIMNIVEKNKWYIKSGMCRYRNMIHLHVALYGARFALVPF